LRKQIYAHTSHVFCPIWLGFGTRDLHVMVFDICEFRENRRRVARAAVTGVDKIASGVCTVTLRDILKVKSGYVKSVYCVTVCFICRRVLFPASYMLSCGSFTGVCSLNANVSEHSVRSIFIGE
jgi:hypothetical protein